EPAVEAGDSADHDGSVAAALSGLFRREAGAFFGAQEGNDFVSRGGAEQPGKRDSQEPRLQSAAGAATSQERPAADITGLRLGVFGEPAGDPRVAADGCGSGV